MKIYISLLVCSESLIAACFIGLFMACLKLPSRTNIFLPPALEAARTLSALHSPLAAADAALLYHHPVILIIIML